MLAMADMKNLLIVTAGIEAATGLALLDDLKRFLTPFLCQALTPWTCGAGLFQHFHGAAWHAAEIGRVRGQHRKAVADCCSTDNEIESAERYSSSERADEVRVDARDFKVERQRAKQLEDCLHERRATRPTLLRIGEMHADEKFRAGGRRYETLAVCTFVR